VETSFFSIIYQHFICKDKDYLRDYKEIYRDMSEIEIFGYISMLVVLLSTMMKDIKRLRIVNSIACVMFIVYGLLLGAYPIVLMNVLVIIIHLFRLIKGEN